MPGRKENLVILPALNEGRFIEQVIKELKKSTDAHVLLIDDGSTDDTAVKARSAGADFIISHHKNRGYGRSLGDGFKFALEHNYKRAATIDCDAQHEPEAVENFFRELKNADIVSGSRYMPGSERKTSPPPQRQKINRQVTLKINELTGYNLTDAFCGFKAYRRRALKIFKISEEGYGMPLQLWLQASRASLRVKEIPVALIYHTRAGFPEELKNPGERLDYYLRVIEDEKKRK